MVFFNTKCFAEGGKVSSANGRVQFCNFMVGSCSDHGRIKSSVIVNDASSVFSKFSSYFGTSFFVAGAIFGEVRG